jgi:inner membrane protein
MPFPVAHGLLGASIVEAWRAKALPDPNLKIFLLAALLAICPDFDFFFIWILSLKGEYHRGPSHSILFAVIVALIVSYLADTPRLRRFFPYLFAALSHGLLDALTSKSLLGVMLLWPFSTKRIKFGFFDYMDFHANIFSFSPYDFLMTFIKISLIEIAIFAPIFLWILWLHLKPQRAEIR